MLLQLPTELAVDNETTGKTGLAGASRFTEDELANWQLTDTPVQSARITPALIVTGSPMLIVAFPPRLTETRVLELHTHLEIDAELKSNISLQTNDEADGIID